MSTVLKDVTSEWEHTANPGEIGCHSRMIGGVLCRWWGDREPSGVANLNDVVRLMARLDGEKADAIAEESPMRPDVEAIRYQLNNPILITTAFGNSVLEVLGYIADLEQQIAKRAKVRVGVHAVWLRERARRQAAEETIAELRARLAVMERAMVIMP